MGKQSEFYDEDPPHGLVKRTLLKKYAQAFIPKVLNTEGLKAIITDGFAGRGKYKPHGWAVDIEKYGSPMIFLLAALQYFYKSSEKKRTHKKWLVCHKATLAALAELAELVPPTRKPETHDRRRPYRLRLFFIDKKQEYYEELKTCVFQYLRAFLRQIDSDANTSIATTISCETVESEEKTVVRVSHDQYPIECTIVRGKFEEIEPPVPNAGDFDVTRRFTFLDPFGFTQTPMSQVKRYLQDENSSVFITFMSLYVDLVITEGTYTTAVGELYGNEGDFEKHKEQDSTARRTQYSGDYIERMKTETGVKYALPFEMRKKAGQNDQDEVLYHMLYFSHHHEGLKEMKEKMNTCSQSEFKFMMSDYKVEVEEIPLHFSNDQDNSVVANEIFKKFKGKAVELGEVENFVLEDTSTPYVFRHGILKIMEEENEPRLIKVDNMDKQDEAKKRRKGTYPSWGNWRLTFRSQDATHAEQPAGPGGAGQLGSPMEQEPQAGPSHVQADLTSSSGCTGHSDVKRA